MDIEIRPEQQQAAQEYLTQMATRHEKEMNFVMPYELSMKFRSLMLIEQDLKFMIETSTKLIAMAIDRQSDNNILSCIWQAIATTYGKICTKSQSGFTSIAENWFKDDHTLIDTHREIMQWRNKFVAHRENSDFEHSYAFFKITKIGNEPEKHTYKIHALARVMPTIEQVELYMRTFTFLLDKTAAKLEKEALRVLTAFYKQDAAFTLHHLVDEKNNQIGAREIEY